MYSCKNCGSDIDDKTDDNFNLYHTMLFCPECGFSYRVSDLESKELTENKDT